MKQYAPPSWTKPGNRWGPRLYRPMLCLSIGLLVWRVIDRDSAGRIAVTAFLVLTWVCLLAANQAAPQAGQTLISLPPQVFQSPSPALLCLLVARLCMGFGYAFLLACRPFFQFNRGHAVFMK